MPPETFTSPDAASVQVLAQSLNWLTERDICILYGITPNTAEAWRKRRKGPTYVLAGNNYLYPRDGVVADLESRRRECARVTKGLL